MAAASGNKEAIVGGPTVERKVTKRSRSTKNAYNRGKLQLKGMDSQLRVLILLMQVKERV